MGTAVQSESHRVAGERSRRCLLHVGHRVHGGGPPGEQLVSPIRLGGAVERQCLEDPIRPKSDRRHTERALRRLLPSGEGLRRGRGLRGSARAPGHSGRAVERDGLGGAADARSRWRRKLRTAHGRVMCLRERLHGGWRLLRPLREHRSSGRTVERDELDAPEHPPSWRCRQCAASERLLSGDERMHGSRPVRRRCRSHENARRALGRQRLDGSINTDPAGTEISRLSGVSCVSTTACTAVGAASETLFSGGSTLVESWNGTTWAIHSSPTPVGAIFPALFGVSCPSATACTAVGYYQNSAGVTVTLAEHWNGSTWVRQGTKNPSSGSVISGLDGVSCHYEIGCTAVGLYGDGTNEYTLAERYS